MGYRVVGLIDEKDVATLADELHPRAIITNPNLAEAVADQISLTPFDVPVISLARCPAWESSIT